MDLCRDRARDSCVNTGPRAGSMWVLGVWTWGLEPALKIWDLKSAVWTCDPRLAVWTRSLELVCLDEHGSQLSPDNTLVSCTG